VFFWKLGLYPGFVRIVSSTTRPMDEINRISEQRKRCQTDIAELERKMTKISSILRETSPQLSSKQSEMNAATSKKSKKALTGEWNKMMTRDNHLITTWLQLCKQKQEILDEDNALSKQIERIKAELPFATLVMTGRSMTPAFFPSIIFTRLDIMIECASAVLTDLGRSFNTSSWRNSPDEYEHRKKNL
jgi:hypothetical protein